MCKGKYLGKDGYGLRYYSNQDGYVYQWRHDVCLGWLCSYAAWARTLHKVLMKGENGCKRQRQN